MFQTKQISVGGFDSNFSYIVTNNENAAIVDPCGNIRKIWTVWNELLKENPSLKPTYILLTHSHPDHISGLDDVKEFFPAPVFASYVSPLPDVCKMHDLEQLPFGEGFIECIATPGHTKDSICFRTSDDSALFTGDTLFVGCCGFCRPDEMFNSMERLKKLAPSLVVYSGHDYGEIPFDTLGHQLKVNPYLTAKNSAEFKERVSQLE